MAAAERALVVAVVAAAIVALPGAHASAWCQMTSSGRSPEPGEPCVLASPPDTFPLAWAHRCTSISFSTMGSNDLSSDEVAAVFADAITTWEGVRCDGQPTGLDVELLVDLNACTGASHFTRDSNVHTVVFVAEGWVEERMHRADAYAVTLVWHDPRSGEIWDVDMEINEARGPYAVCPAEGCTGDVVDLPNVITHEMGHYFGLGHTPDDSLATMWAAAESDETLKRDLRDDDIAGLCAIYPPASLPEACDHTPRGGLNLECVRHASGGFYSDGSCACSTPGARASSRGAGAAALGLAALVIAGARLGRRRRAR